MAIYTPISQNNLQNISSPLDRIFEDMKLNDTELNNCDGSPATKSKKLG